MLADPSYLRESVLAYYPFVERIVVSYDRSATSWTGTPLPIAQCLETIRLLDVDSKCVELPGDFAPTVDPLQNDTVQRQSALDAASDGVDWVVQLDTDEVMARPEAFFSSLARAEEASAGGLDYPARWLYSRVGEGRYLEQTTRFWRPAMSYPGPLAVRAGTRLRLARQADVALHRVDVGRRNTDPWHPRDAPVDEVVKLSDAVLHFSWVRDPAVIRRKFAWSGHADELASPTVYRRWVHRTAHPWSTVLSTPLRRRDAGWYRLSTIAEPPGGPPPTVKLDGSVGAR